MSEKDADWTRALLPGTTIWLPSCGECGALVLNTQRHDQWHDAQRNAASKGPVA